ncbi:MAG: ketol-acid reductoisomerase [Armatimonadetes bacterium]|nr:ketol-acid reductoisomerase [Armatimonadota bacterium]
MAKIFYESDVDPEVIRSKCVGVIGYGSQGHAHALNLKESGVDVRVGLRETSESRATAEQDGLVVMAAAKLAEWANVLMFCTPDLPMKDIYKFEVEGHLRSGQTLLFAHGFSIHYGLIQPPPDVNVALVAPNGAGPMLRDAYLSGGGLPAGLAVDRDATGDALAVALSYAWGLGCARAGILATTFKEETETDLFGEQVVLCGGIPELIKAAFQTLVDAGYQPEAAYLVCLHEVKLIVDLIYRGGLKGMRSAISATAEWGGYTAGSRVIGEDSRRAMEEILEEIRGGTFARDWLSESESGGPGLERFRESERIHPIEEVGARMRRMMFKNLG